MDAGAPLPPEDLWERLDEFLGVKLSEDPLRKMGLGVGLNEERRDLVDRMLSAVPYCREHPEHWDYWDKLFQVYTKISEALYVPNEDELRTYGAKVIFRGEEESESSVGLDPAPVHAAGWYEPVAASRGTAGASSHHQ